MKTILTERGNKEVYLEDGVVVKKFHASHPKADVFNEALNVARVETTGLKVSSVREVKQIDGSWAVMLDYVPGKTMKEVMDENPEEFPRLLEQFVDLQIEMHKKSCPLLNKMRDKMKRQIAACPDVSEAVKFELSARLSGMPRHNKLCHGDFCPENVIVGEDGSFTIIDWSHATQGNASGDAANTYLLFALENMEIADMYLKLFCKKTGTGRRYVERWLSIVAAAEFSRGRSEKAEFLKSWLDVVDFE